MKLTVTRFAFGCGLPPETPESGKGGEGPFLGSESEFHHRGVECSTFDMLHNVSLKFYSQETHKNLSLFMCLRIWNIQLRDDKENEEKAFLL